MGTRNLTCVVLNGEYKVAQYGQWDGYPTSLGNSIVAFINEQGNLDKLSNSLSKCRFLNEEDDKEWLELYDKNAPKFTRDPDNRTKEQREWFELFITRNLASEVLYNIINSKEKEILLKDSLVFAGDSLFCEWAYVIDLDNDILEIYRGYHREPLSEDDRFYGFKKEFEDYEPIKMVKKYYFNELMDSTMGDLENELSDED